MPRHFTLFSLTVRLMGRPVRWVIAAIPALALIATLPASTRAAGGESETFGQLGGGNNGQFALWGRGIGSCQYGLVHPANTVGQRSTWGMMVAGNFSGDAYSEVFLYDPLNAEAEFRRPDTTTWAPIGSTLFGFRDSWSAIVSGRFGGSPTRDDLFFYDPIASEGEFWSTDGAGHINKIGTTWTGINPRVALIVAGNFGPEAQSELMFYDPVEGTLKFYSTVTRNQIGTTLTSIRTSWTQIVAGNFGGGTGYQDLFFYDASNGEAAFYRTNGSGGITSIGVPLAGLRRTWNQLFAGDFHTPCDASASLDDLYFCEKNTGVTEYYGTDGNGGIYQFAVGGADPNWGLSVPGRFFPGRDWTQVLGYSPGWMPNDISNLYIVAHCDDDFLFMNPDINDALLRRERLRIIYLTAGQTDRGSNYWRDGRERGALRGYAKLAGTPGSSWSRVGSGTPALYRLDAYPWLELQFVRLPSGDEYGDPFAPYNASLVSLWEGNTSSLSTVDNAAQYTLNGLVSLLTSTMFEVGADRVCLMDDQNWNGAIGQGIPGNSYNYGGAGGLGSYVYDHKDHCASARFGLTALRDYSPVHTLTQFIGYTIATRPTNVTGSALRRKLVAFGEYARCDLNIPPSQPFGGLYDPWIRRQYTKQATVGVPEAGSAPATGSLSVFPNPARGKVTLTLQSSGDVRLRAASFGIFDVAGRLRGRGELAGSAGNRWSLPISDLTPGIYLISVMDHEGVVLQSGRFEILN